MASCNPVKVQIVRGIIGAAALIVAYFLFEVHPAASLLFIALSALAMKGCPVCWLVEMCAVAGETRGNRKETKCPPTNPTSDPPA